MKSNPVVWTLTRRGLYRLLMLVAAIGFLLGTPYLRAQKVQDTYKDTIKIGSSDSALAIATSADGQYVFVVGKAGLIVSDDHGKTGSWVQTLKLK